MASHKCASWSPFGHKPSGLDVSFVRAKDKVQSRSVVTKSVNIPSNNPQVFDVDQVRFREFNGGGLKYYDIDGRILNKLAGESVHVEPTTFFVTIDCDTDTDNEKEILNKMRTDLKSLGVQSIQSV